MLQVCDLSDPNHLWETHKEHLSEEVLHHVRRQNPDVNVQHSGDVLHLSWRTKSSPWVAKSLRSTACQPLAGSGTCYDP
ncbi:hypothetical protein Pmani_002733 [Petrolisthes manimaculis]|uniref:Uncharacterized protein n=1 Tax=Petrolisthes manimaculis TaxID=1843537 RepID=A0AAE1QHP6_9EUCA|nr:hypothetical protein Pmani_002733 [Petrolisthes manimaculis]